MNTTDARSLLVRLVASIAPEADVDAADPRKPIQEELDLDSMDMLSLFTALADRTGIDVPERDYPKLASIDGFVAYVTTVSEASTSSGS